MELADFPACYRGENAIEDEELGPPGDSHLEVLLRGELHLSLAGGRTGRLPLPAFDLLRQLARLYRCVLAVSLCLVAGLTELLEESEAQMFLILRGRSRHKSLRQKQINRIDALP